MDKMSSSLQSWIEDHKLTSIGALWATAVGASVAYSRKKSPQRSTSIRLIHARMHAQALTVAVLGGAALMHYYNKNKARRKADDSLDDEFYSQLPPASSPNGEEDDRWCW